VVGVGVILNHTSKHGRNGLFVDSFVDGPAKECNRIFPGDQLLTIDNHDVETSRIEDLTYLLPGPPGSKVSKAVAWEQDVRRHIAKRSDGWREYSKSR
jgi:C-terminal processing protease CtpA/Prc